MEEDFWWQSAVSPDWHVTNTVYFMRMQTLRIHEKGANFPSVLERPRRGNAKVWQREDSVISAVATWPEQTYPQERSWSNAVITLLRGIHLEAQGLSPPPVTLPRADLFHLKNRSVEKSFRKRPLLCSCVLESQAGQILFGWRRQTLVLTRTRCSWIRPLWLEAIALRPLLKHTHTHSCPPLSFCPLCPLSLQLSVHLQLNGLSIAHPFVALFFVPGSCSGPSTSGTNPAAPCSWPPTGQTCPPR